MEARDKVRTFVVETFLFGDGAHLTENTSFLKENIIDSTGILEIIAFLEAEYNIKIEDNEILPENLDSLNNISSFLKRKMATDNAGE